MFRDIAELECQLARAFNAADSTVVILADMATLPAEAWPGLVMKLHPSVALFDYQWNILPFWKAAKRVLNDPEAEQPEMTPERLEQPVSCLVWRNQIKTDSLRTHSPQTHSTQTRFRSLDTEEAHAIHLVQQGASFAQLCETLAEQVDDPEQIPLRAAGFLKTWIESELVAELCY